MSRESHSDHYPSASHSIERATLAAPFQGPAIRPLLPTPRQKPVALPGETWEPGYPKWPSLDRLGLSPEARARRLTLIGASDANIILSGSDESVQRLWREKRGEQDSEDLSGNLAVMLGCWSESFNRQAHALADRRIVDAGYRLGWLLETNISARVSRETQ